MTILKSYVSLLQKMLGAVRPVDERDIHIQLLQTVASQHNPSGCKHMTNHNA